MRAALSRAIVVAALPIATALGSCSADIPQGVFRCTTDTQCPGGFVCRTSEQLCYRSGDGPSAAGSPAPASPAPASVDTSGFSIVVAEINIQNEEDTNAGGLDLEVFLFEAGSDRFIGCVELQEVDDIDLLYEPMAPLVAATTGGPLTLGDLSVSSLYEIRVIENDDLPTQSCPNLYASRSDNVGIVPDVSTADLQSGLVVQDERNIKFMRIEARPQ